LRPSPLATNRRRESPNCKEEFMEEMKAVPEDGETVVEIGDLLARLLKIDEDRSALIKDIEAAKEKLETGAKQLSAVLGGGKRRRGRGKAKAKSPSSGKTIDEVISAVEAKHGKKNPLDTLNEGTKPKRKYTKRAKKSE